MDNFLKENRCAKCGKSEEYVNLDRHHTLTKSRGGKTTIYLCRPCHEWIGENIDKAKELGLYEEGYNIDK